MAKVDLRPICNCGAYDFPHKLGGGLCYGYDYAEFYFLHDKSSCKFCNCNRDNTCDCITGQEDIKHGECYIEAIGNGHVRLSFENKEIEEYDCEYML